MSPAITDEQLKALANKMKTTIIRFSLDYVFWLALVCPIIIYEASIITISSVIIDQSKKLLRYEGRLSHHQQYMLTMTRTAHVIIIVLNLVLLIIGVIGLIFQPLVFFISVIISILSVILSIVLIWCINDLLPTFIRWITLGIQIMNILLLIIWYIMNFHVGGTWMTLFIKKYILRDPGLQNKDIDILKRCTSDWNKYSQDKEFLQKLRKELAPTD